MYTRKKRKKEQDSGNLQVRQRQTRKDCNVSKLDKDDLNSMRCEDCEYTENKSRAYCHGVCNKTHEGKLRLCNRYINANSERNSPYLCKDHQTQTDEVVKGEFKVRIVIIGNDVSYEGEHGHEYTVELCGKNRFLKKQEKKHEYGKNRTQQLRENYANSSQSSASTSRSPASSSSDQKVQVIPEFYDDVYQELMGFVGTSELSYFCNAEDSRSCLAITELKNREMKEKKEKIMNLAVNWTRDRNKRRVSYCFIHKAAGIVQEILAVSPHNDPGTYKYIIYDIGHECEKEFCFYPGTQWITKPLGGLLRHFMRLILNGYELDKDCEKMKTLGYIYQGHRVL